MRLGEDADDIIPESPERLHIITPPNIRSD